MSTNAYTPMGNSMGTAESLTQNPPRVIVPAESKPQRKSRQNKINIFKLAGDIGVVLAFSLLLVLVLSAIVYGGYVVSTEFASWNVQDFKDAMVGYR